MLLLKFNEIKQKLIEKNSTLYWVHSDESLLLLEAKDLVRDHARSMGYGHRRLFIINNHSDWELAKEIFFARSLFFQREMIEFQINCNIPSKDHSSVLENIAEKNFQDFFYLITSSKIEKKHLKSILLEKIASRGVVVAIPKVRTEELTTWIQIKLEENKQSVCEKGLSLFAQYFEGHLLAAHQEIQKLSLIYPPGLITLEKIKTAISDVARYEVFKLTEVLLAGNQQQLFEVMKSLQEQNIPPALVLWAITKEIRLLLSLKTGLNLGKSMSQLLSKSRTWGKHTKLLKIKLEKVTKEQLQSSLRYAHQIDLAIKGLSPVEVWFSLFRLSLMNTMRGES